MKNVLYYIFIFVFILQSCTKTKTIEKVIVEETEIETNYFDYTNRDDQFMGGIKMIPISTPKGEFNVWTKRIGNNPKIKVLLLHGGPGMTHEIYESFDGYFPQEGIEYYLSLIHI